MADEMLTVGRPLPVALRGGCFGDDDDGAAAVPVFFVTMCLLYRCLWVCSTGTCRRCDRPETTSNRGRTRILAARGFVKGSVVDQVHLEAGSDGVTRASLG